MDNVRSQQIREGHDRFDPPRPKHQNITTHASCRLKQYTLKMFKRSYTDFVEWSKVVTVVSIGRLRKHCLSVEDLEHCPLSLKHNDKPRGRSVFILELHAAPVSCCVRGAFQHAAKLQNGILF